MQSAIYSSNILAEHFQTLMVAPQILATHKQMHTYRIQSTAMINEMPWRGSPTDVNTIAMDTMPPCGIPVAPIAATVAVMLE